jgi:hypothetical protein
MQDLRGRFSALIANDQHVVANGLSRMVELSDFEHQARIAARKLSRLLSKSNLTC